MTESEWLAATDPAPMFLEIAPQTSVRKLRLFACGCCRDLWDLLSGDDRTFVEMAEGYADGAFSTDEIQAASGHQATDSPRSLLGHYGSSLAPSVVGELTSFDAWGSTRRVRALVVEIVRATGLTTRDAEWRRQSDLLRCVFGNPFDPVGADPSCLTWNDGIIPKLARSVYDDRSFHRLPLLADALEDAGCADRSVLAHCRGPGPHVRGCWVIDLLLGKM
jgi:hypothetical protein